MSRNALPVSDRRDDHEQGEGADDREDQRARVVAAALVRRRSLAPGRCADQVPPGAAQATPDRGRTIGAVFASPGTVVFERLRHTPESAHRGPRWSGPSGARRSAATRREGRHPGSPDQRLCCAPMLKDAAAIAGIGQTRFAKRLAPDELELAGEAILAALDDAGIEPSEVDGLASYTMESYDEVEVAKNIGAGDVTFFSRVGYGGGAGPACVGHLAMAVATGQCRVGVAWRSRKRGSGQRPWAGAVQASAQATWTRPHGLLRARRRDRDVDATLHARVRRDARSPGERGRRRARHGQPQPERPDVRAGARPRGLHAGALDLGAALPLRQLPRNRRRPRLRGGVPRASARLPTAPGSAAQLRPGAARPAPHDGELLVRRPAARPGLDLRPPSSTGARTSAPRTSPWLSSTTPSLR